MKSINLDTIMRNRSEIAKLANHKQYAEEQIAKEWMTDFYKREAETATAKIAALTDEIAPMIEKIAAAIKEAEGRATARTITPEDIFYRLEQINERIDIPNSRMKGVKVTVNDGAQTFPSAYKYNPESTWFEAEHTGHHWKLTSIYRYHCNNRIADITLSDTAKEAIVERATHL